MLVPNSCEKRIIFDTTKVKWPPGLNKNPMSLAEIEKIFVVKIGMHFHLHPSDGDPNLQGSFKMIDRDIAQSNMSDFMPLTQRIHCMEGFFNRNSAIRPM